MAVGVEITPKSACGPEGDWLSCPCRGFAYGESGQLDLVRVVNGREIDRLELTPLFGKVLANQDGAIVERWEVQDKDFEESEAKGFAARVRTRPVVKIMHFADYNHDDNPLSFSCKSTRNPAERSRESWSA